MIETMASVGKHEMEHTSLLKFIYQITKVGRSIRHFLELNPFGFFLFGEPLFFRLLCTERVPSRLWRPTVVLL